MLRDLPFNEHVAEYEEWFEQNPNVFQSELAAIRKAWPAGQQLKSLEIGSASGRFMEALGISEGIEPALNMRKKAEERGRSVICGVAESLPYQDDQFDVVLMNFCVSYLEDPDKSFAEVRRVLKPGGSFLLGMLDKKSSLAQAYEKKKPSSVFYKDAKFYSTGDISSRLSMAGFSNLDYLQTLFSDPATLRSVEEPMAGHGKGSYVLIRAHK